MKNIILLTMLLGLSVSVLNGQVKLTADNGKSTLNWLGEKVTGQHTGTINLQNGWITMKENRITGGEFEIDMASLKDKEGNAMLEKHLKSADFFDVEKYPTAKLVLKSSESFDKGTAVVKADLTIKGVTNPIEFKATAQKKDDGNWFYSNITIDRTKWSIKYGSGSFFDNLGDKTIYDEFKLKVALLVK
ncbi:MAG TPA: YceI family protein [Bacteroidales bacterium]|nr:YceI family protein [Bacteroidales bacterium]